MLEVAAMAIVISLAAILVAAAVMAVGMVGWIVFMLAKDIWDEIQSDRKWKKFWAEHHKEYEG